MNPDQPVHNFNPGDDADIEKFALIGDRGKVCPNYPYMVEYLKDKFGAISYKDTLFIYASDIYKENQNQIESECKDLLAYHARKHKQESLKISPYIDEIIRRLKIDSPEPEYPFNKNRDLIPVRNGIIKIDYETSDKNLIPHDAKYRFTYKLPVDYNPDAPIEPIYSVLSQWVNDNDVDILLQYPAQCLLEAQGHHFKKNYIFEGETNAGKSTYCDLIMAFLGPENVSDVALQTLIRDNFAWGDLEHKLSNFHDELSNFPINCTGPFKDITGKEIHRINRKYKEAYDAPITAIHAFSCNVPPKIVDHGDDAFFGRFEYVVFPNKFPIDPSYKKRLLTGENLSGFLNLVIEMMIRINKEGKLPRMSTPDEVRSQWLPASDNIEKFFQTHLVLDKDHYILQDDLYRAYIYECEKTSVKCEPQRTLTLVLKGKGIEISQPRAEGKKRVYKGIRWREDSPYKECINGIQKALVCDTGDTGS